MRAIPVRSEFGACDVRREKHIAMNLVQRHASWNSTNPRVTIVEADITLALALSHNLKTEGYVVENVDRSPGGRAVDVAIWSSATCPRSMPSSRHKCSKSEFEIRSHGHECLNAAAE